ncbi:Nucleolar MIF4G domain-containing protein 1 like, partial [Pseudolycoriella hygida]
MKFSEQILQLAKKQRMNTDDRRNVFCILMTAEDYIEAFEKLNRLGIKDHRVIPTVIIHCCLSEKIFNPYYAVLAQTFCEGDRSYLLPIKFAIWDRIKDIQSHSNIQIKNLAQFLIHLISHRGQPLSILKVVDFAELDKPTLRLVRQTVLGLLLVSEHLFRQVFDRIASSYELKAFRESIRLFMHHFLLKGGSKSGVAENKMKLLKKRIEIADEALQTIDSLV